MKKSLQQIINIDKFFHEKSTINFVFVLFITLHLFLLNINFAEWGDSYRILRASEYLRSFDYPSDEKRPPLYSLLLSIRPSVVDPIIWGKILMLLISTLTFILFTKIASEFFSNNYYKTNLASLFLALNPVFLYWSLRIYADVFFALIVLLATLVYIKRYKRVNSYLNIFILGFITSLGIVTRFEGFILFGALGIGITFSEGFVNLTYQIRENLGKVLSYALTVVLMIFPYFIWRNPFTSSYLSEPSGRVFGVNEIVIFFASVAFCGGSILYFIFISQSINTIKKFLVENTFIGSYLLFILILSLLWPAAIPRLLVSAIPFGILLFVVQYTSVLEFTKKQVIIVSSLLIGFYILVQYKYKLQFLLPSKQLMVIVILMGLLSLLAYLLRNKNLLLLSFILSMFVWSLTVVYLHKDIFKVVTLGAKFAGRGLDGVVAYNDISAVSDWYLNNDPLRNPKVSGKFLPYYKKSDASLSNLRAIGSDYLLITNEHNLSMTFDDSDKPYLEKVAEYTETVNGGSFFTKVYKVKYN